MKKLRTQILVAVFTFYAGIGASLIWLAFYGEVIHKHSMKTCSLAPNEIKISESEAIRLAECFVIKNGYTAFNPIADKSEISKEWTDSSLVEETLEMRFDTLKSKAYGVKSQGERGWSVVFNYNFRNPRIGRLDSKFIEHLKNVGRVVTIDSYGRNPRIEHEDFELETFRQTSEPSAK